MVIRDNKGLLVVISGASGVGKGTISKNISKETGAWLSVSATSRKMRDEDEDGVTYYFITKEEFEERIRNNMFLEYASYNGNYYGTPKDKIMEHLDKGIDTILEIEVQGGRQIRDLFPEAVLIYLMPPSFEVLKERLIGRHSETIDDINKRMDIAKEELNHLDYYDYVVVNDNVDMAISDVIGIMKSEKLKKSRIKEIKLKF